MRLAAMMAVALMASATAEAAPVAPTSYDIPYAGGYPDDTYTGTYENGMLVGGLGDLSDGLAPTAHWNPPYEARYPFVGWQGFNPQLTFHFQPDTTLGSAVLYFDDYGGGAGVVMPNAVTITINGTDYAGTVAHNGTGASPVSFDFGSGITTDTATIQITSGGEWTFMSEASFDSAAPVPEPGEWAMIAAGLGLVGAVARRRKQG